MSGVNMEAYIRKAYASKQAGSSAAGISRLPLELQDAIVANLSYTSLRRLQRVSKHFHDRASSRIWRKLHFKLFPGPLAPGNSAQLKIADVLRTITTSDHDYAQYIHELEVKVIDDSVSGSNDDLVAARFLADTDAQKLLSLSLYMLLRRATSLEKFKWKAPIEVDSACWKELAKSQTLRRLVVQVNARSHVYLGRNAEPPTELSYRHISGCSNLIWLSVSEIDDVNHFDALATCIRSSAASLKLLKLTFSTSLAAKAKKSASTTASLPPPPPIDVPFDSVDDNSSVDDDVHVAAVTYGQAVDPDVVKKHKNLQETALARILSVESDAASKSVEQALAAAVKPPSKTVETDPQKAKSLRSLLDKVLDGKKLDSDADLQLLEQLRDQLGNVVASRSVKRQKASSSTKNKGSKSAKTSAAGKTYHPYQPSHSMPKSSNTSTLSNPWGAPPGLSHASNAAAAFGSSSTSPYPFPSNVTPSAQMPPFGTPTTVVPGSLYTGAQNHTLGSLLAGDLQAQQMQAQQLQQLDKYDDLFIGGGGSSGKIPISFTPAFLEAVKFSTQPLSSPPGDLELASSLSPMFAELQHTVNMFKAVASPHIYFKAKAMLTKDKAPPPPPAFGSNTKAKSAKKKAPFVPAFHVDELSETSESSSEELTSAAGSTPVENAASEETKITSYDDMGVDIVHPDDDSAGGDSENEQEVTDDGDDTPRSLEDKGKGKEVAIDVAAQPLAHTASSSTKVREAAETEVKATSPEQMMSEWIRKKHGIAIENLQLYLIPLKASVLGRALQLHALKRITLLSVGGQGPFWQLMCKAHEERPLNITEIHTDDVSTPFLECVSKLHGVKSLILRRRSKKDNDNTTSKDPASIDEIRKLAVQPHIGTLSVLSIENSQDQSWCLTQGLIWLICARGEQIRELSFHCGTHRFWEFMKLAGAGAVTPDNKMRLPNLTVLHYLGTGVTTPTRQIVTQAPPGPTGSGPNGEPLDPNHDLWIRDHYKTCQEQMHNWARNRRAAGDANLKFIALNNSYWELGGSPPGPYIPRWLRDDWSRAAEASDEADRKGKSSKVTSTAKFYKWLDEQGYSGLSDSSLITIKAKRPQECRAMVFSKTVRQAKI